MTDIPDQPILRRIEHVVKGNSEFDHAESGTQVPAGHRDRVDGLGAQLIRDLLQLALVEPPQVVRGVNLVEQGGFGLLSHNFSDKSMKRQYFRTPATPGGGPHRGTSPYKASRVDWNPEGFQPIL
jgi:hypothetical protein